MQQSAKDRFGGTYQGYLDAYYDYYYYGTPLPEQPTNVTETNKTGSGETGTVTLPQSAFEVGNNRVRTKEAFGFISKYSRSSNGTMKENGSWMAVGAKIGWPKITDKQYYNGQWYYYVSGNKALYGDGWIKGHQIEAYDTGGYTGDWGPEGKLAMLHQKELVLNAEDTENILNTVSFVRDLISSIDSSATMSSLRDLFAYTATNNFGSNVEQDIKIYAEFPSATNHSEIEEAFNNLLNTASQYANRKN